MRDEARGNDRSLGSSGANIGPRKNREYKPFLAASRFAIAITEACGYASESGVEDPDAGVPDIGLLLEMMPVAVRLSWRVVEVS
jgi:hypothetical protein